MIMASWLVWFEGRNTGIAVSSGSRSAAISAARKKKKRGGDKVVSARQMTASEKKTASKGNWVSTKRPGYKGGKGCYGKSSKSCGK